MSSYGYAGFTQVIGDIVARWGPILLYASLAYTVMGSLVYIWLLSSGIEPTTALLPPGIERLTMSAFTSWQKLSDVFADGKLSLGEIPGLLAFVATTSMLFLGLLLQSAINYIWIAIQLSELIPPPYQFLTLIVWVALGAAQLILIIYIVQRLMPIISDLASRLTSIIFGRIP